MLVIIILIFIVLVNVPILTTAPMLGAKNNNLVLVGSQVFNVLH